MTAKELIKDQRGGVMLIGLFMALSLIGALWFLIGIGDAIVFRDHMQEVADSVAFSSAAVHARGMNMIAALNLILFAMISLYLILALIDLISVAVAAALTVCSLAPTPAAPVCAGPAGIARGVHTFTHTIWELYCAPAQLFLSLSSMVQSAVGLLAPWGGLLSGIDSAHAYDQEGIALSPSMIPGAAISSGGLNPLGGGPFRTARKAAKSGKDPKFSFRGIDARLGLPVVNQELREGCGHPARFAVEFAYQKLAEIPGLGPILNFGVGPINVGRIIRNAIEDIAATTAMVTLCPSIVHDPLEIAALKPPKGKKEVPAPPNPLELASGKLFPALTAGSTPKALPGVPQLKAIGPGTSASINFLIPTELFADLSPAELAKLQDRLAKVEALAKGGATQGERDAAAARAAALRAKIAANGGTPKPPVTNPNGPKELPPGKTPKELPPGKTPKDAEEPPPILYDPMNPSGWIDWDRPGQKKTFLFGTNGSDWLQVWGFVVKPEFKTAVGAKGDTSENKMTLAESRGVGELGVTQPTVDNKYSAQAEFYFDCNGAWNSFDCNGENYWELARSLYSIRWRARLRRVRPIDVAGMLNEWVGSLFLSANVKNWLVGSGRGGLFKRIGVNAFTQVISPFYPRSAQLDSANYH
jgi:hypothetical protein